MSGLQHGENVEVVSVCLRRRKVLSARALKCRRPLTDQLVGMVLLLSMSQSTFFKKMHNRTSLKSISTFSSEFYTNVDNVVFSLFVKIHKRLKTCSEVNSIELYLFACWCFADSQRLPGIRKSNNHLRAVESGISQAWLA